MHTASSTILRPFNFSARLKRPRFGLDATPFIDLLAIGMLFWLVRSEFIFAPGLEIDWPVAAEESLDGASVSAVLTVVEKDMLLYRGGTYDRSSIAEVLAEGARETSEDEALLIKMGAGVEVQTLFDVAQLAREAGYPRVLIPAASDSEEGLR